MKNINLIVVPAICYFIGVAFYSFDPLLQSFPAILTDELMKTYSVTSVGVGFIAASYYYSYNLMQIPAGILCDRFGPRNILMIALIICILGLAVFAISKSIATAIFARILMGFGGSTAAVILILLCRQYFNICYLPILVGVAQFFGNIGSICGQYPLSIISTEYGWRTAISFIIILPFVLLIFAYIFLGNLNSGIAFSQKDFSNFYKKVKAVISSKNNWLIFLYAMCLWTGFYIFASLWGIPYLKLALNLSTSQASGLIAVTWIASGIGSILIGILATKLNKKKACLVFSALLGLLIYPLVIRISNDLAIAALILFCFGCSSAGQALSFALINDNNHESVLGSAVGFLNTIIMMGTMLVDPIVGWLLRSNWNGVLSEGIPVYSLDDYHRAFIIIPIFFACAFIIALYLKEDAEIVIKQFAIDNSLEN